jgi:hypothetical protein
MASNHKLTGVLKGRKITGTQSQGNELQISFNGGSTMTVRTGGAVSRAATGRTVKAVREEGTRLNLDFEEGGTLEIQTAEPTASLPQLRRAAATSFPHSFRSARSLRPARWPCRCAALPCQLAFCACRRAFR